MIGRCILESIKYRIRCENKIVIYTMQIIHAVANLALSRNGYSTNQVKGIFIYKAGRMILLAALFCWGALGCSSDSFVPPDPLLSPQAEIAASRGQTRAALEQRTEPAPLATHCATRAVWLETRVARVAQLWELGPSPPAHPARLTAVRRNCHRSPINASLRGASGSDVGCHGVSLGQVCLRLGLR